MVPEIKDGTNDVSDNGGSNRAGGMILRQSLTDPNA
jgi:hypothetical protein